MQVLDRRIERSYSDYKKTFFVVKKVIEEHLEITRKFEFEAPTNRL